MKLLPFFCPTPVAAGGDDSEAATTTTIASTLHSNLSLQTLPSVSSLSLLDDTTSSLTLTPTLTTTLSLSSSIASLSLSSTHLFAASGHLINVYDISTLSPLETFNTTGTSAGSVKSLAFSTTAGELLTAHQNGKIKLWKFSPTEKHHHLTTTLPTLTDRLHRFPLPKNHVQVRRHKKRLWIEHHDAVSSLAVGPNFIYSVSWDKTLKVWAKSKCLQSLTAHEDAINAVTVSGDGVVYTGSADGRIRVWSSGLNSIHSEVATLEKHKSGVNALVLNTEGSILFSGSCDRSILVWEREDSGKYMGVSGALRGHNGSILCLIYVGDFLISGSGDRTIRIWRRGFDGRFSCLSVLVGHLKAVKSLVGRMEGEDEISVFSGGLDGEIKVWKVKINYSNNNYYYGKS